MARDATDGAPLIESVLLLEKVREKRKKGEHVKLTLEEKKRLYVVAYSLTTVYFIAAADAGMIKIGKTTDLNKRLATLRTMSPVPLEVACTISYDDRLEWRLHTHFSKYRSHGEWFYAEKEIVDFMRGYKDKGIQFVVDTVGDSGSFWMNSRDGATEGMRAYLTRCGKHLDPDYKPGC